MTVDLNEADSGAEQNTIDLDELELRLATTLAPMLLTVSIFSLTLVGITQKPDTTILDEVLCLLSLFCILSAALVADSALDKANLDFLNRTRFLGGGYVLFCIVAGVMSFVVPLLYIAKNPPSTELAGWYYIIYAATATSVSTKLMQNKEVGWTAGMFVLVVISLAITTAI